MMMIAAAAAGNDWICDSANGIMRPSTNPIDPVLEGRKRERAKEIELFKSFNHFHGYLKNVSG